MLAEQIKANYLDAFEPAILVKIASYFVEADVLDRLDGCEDYRDDFGNRIFNLKTIKEMINNPDDDTNKTTRVRIECLVEVAEGLNAEKILIIA